MNIKNILGFKGFYSIVIITFSFILTAAYLHAEELAVDPNDVIAPPSDITFTAFYSVNSKSDKLYRNGNVVLNDADLQTNMGVLRLGHNFDIAGLKVMPQLVVTYGHIDLGRNLVSQPARSSTGFGDPVIGATTWLIADPESRTWLGIPAYLSIPMGDYDGQHGAFNIGENRWKAITQLGYAKGITDKVFVEAIGELSFYGKNNNFNGMKMQQDPSQSLMGHLTYKVNDKTSISMSYYHTFGGESRLNGIDQSDRKNNNRWLATASTWVAPGLNIQLQYGQDIETKNGFKQGDRVNLRLAKVF